MKIILTLQDNKHFKAVRIQIFYKGINTSFQNEVILNLSMLHLPMQTVQSADQHFGLH
jgi:hypothetical protein